MDEKTLSETRFSRRTVLKLMGLGAASFALPGCSTAGVRRVPSSVGAAVPIEPPADPTDFGPVNRRRGNPAARVFTGDSPERAHRLLWNKQEFLASRRELASLTEEEVPLVVIGGGISGLVAAYALRAHKPVLLEQADRFGGNSRAESWQGIDYSIGAAYFSQPEAGSARGKLYDELGLGKIARLKDTEDPVFLSGKTYSAFWSGQSDPEHAAQIRAVAGYLRRVQDGDSYPTIPAASPAAQTYLQSLDRESLRTHLQKVAGAALHPHLALELEIYCRSAFAASADEVSAAAGLNFLSSEFGRICVAPGGNAAVAARLVDALAGALPRGNLRPSALVCDVKVADNKVRVTYQDAQGGLRRLSARAAVLACPKFVAARLIDELEADRAAAIKRLSYRAYLVANVLLDAPAPQRFYDLYLLDERPVTAPSATDVVLGTYAAPDAHRTVLTLYRSFPFEGGRPELLGAGSYEKYRAQFEAQVRSAVLPAIGFSAPNKVVDIRLARWGHAFPVPKLGLITDGTCDTIQRPFRERVFFVQQDNWCLPAFETAVDEAFRWAPAIEKVLG